MQSLRTQHQRHLVGFLDAGRARRVHIGKIGRADYALRPVEGRHAAGQIIGHTDEICDKEGSRRFIDFRWRADLQDTPLVQDGDPIRHRERFLLVMRHIHKRQPHVLLDGFEFDLHVQTELLVERAQWLVEQHNGRTIDQGASQGHPLLLASR